MHGTTLILKRGKALVEIHLPPYGLLGMKRGVAAGVCLLFALSLGVLLYETIDPSCRIHDLLFSGHERMALRTDFHLDVLFR